MKKFSIKDLNIIHKDEKINALKLENKNEKFILYGNTNKNIQENAKIYIFFFLLNKTKKFIEK